METITNNDAYCSVEITKDCINQLSFNEVVLSIPRNSITEIVLKKGIASERPIIQIIFSIILMIVGFYGLRYFYNWLIQGGTLYVDISFGLILLIPLGLLLFFLAIRHRILLVVKTIKDKRKIVFHKKAELNKVKDFLLSIKNKYNYQINISI